MAITQTATGGIKDDAVTEAKLANAINTAVAANTAKDLTALSASNLTSGTIPDDRFPATLPAASAANLTSVPAGNITGTLPAISGANLTNLPASGKATNLVINGAMNVAQRGTGATGSGANGYATVDRWQATQNGTDAYIEQYQVDVASGTTPYTLGFRKAFQIKNGDQSSGAGSNDHVRMSTFLEGQDIAQSGWNYKSASSYITLSFWVKSSVAQNFYGFIRSTDGTMQQYPFETGSLSADTWTKVTKTIPGNSNLAFDNNTGGAFELWIHQFAGTDQTASGVTLNAWAAYDGTAKMPDNTSTWYTTNDSTFDLTGVQLEVGDAATDFAHASYADDLLRCKRYFNMIANGDGGSYHAVSDGFFWSANEVDFMYTFPVEMRAAPSIYQVTGANYFKVQGGGQGGTTYIDGNWTQQYGSKMSTSQYAGPDTSGTIGFSCHITVNNPAARLGYQAEL